MIAILDASACVEFLLGTRLGAAVAAEVIAADSLHAPELLVSEVVSALRGLTRAGTISPTDATLALRDLARLDVHLVGVLPLAEQIYRLGAAHSTYDAHYVALARAIGGVVITTDAKLASARDPDEVRLVRRD